MIKELKIHSKFKPLRTSSSRYFIISGGRGSSKSFSVSTNLLLLTYEAGHVILFTRYTMVSAHISIIPEFLGKIEMLGLESDFEITSTSITNIKTGSKIIFKGLKAGSGNQTANLKSIADVTTFVLDEAEELHDEELFNKVDESVRKLGVQNRVILILNPTTKEHWVYRRFFQECGVEGGSNTTKDGVTYIHTTYLDNIDNLSQSFIESAERLKIRRPKDYESRMMGAWLSKAEGVVFENWKLGEFKETNSTMYGQDYGFKKDASTLCKIAIDYDKNIIYIKELFYKHGLDTSSLFNETIKHCKNDLIIADNSEPRLISELENLGLNIEACKKGAGSVNFGISIMKSYDLIIDPSSVNLIKELNHYAWLKNSDKPIDNHNHIIDAVRYAVTYLVENSHRGEYNVW